MKNGSLNINPYFLGKIMKISSSADIVQRNIGHFIQTVFYCPRKQGLICIFVKSCFLCGNYKKTSRMYRLQSLTSAC